jgi:hypothetical protein
MRFGRSPGGEKMPFVQYPVDDKTCQHTPAHASLGSSPPGRDSLLRPFLYPVCPASCIVPVCQDQPLTNRSQSSSEPASARCAWRGA